MHNSLGIYREVREWLLTEETQPSTGGYMSAQLAEGRAIMGRDVPVMKSRAGDGKICVMPEACLERR